MLSNRFKVNKVQLGENYLLRKQIPKVVLQVNGMLAKQVGSRVVDRQGLKGRIRVVRKHLVVKERYRGVQPRRIQRSIRCMFRAENKMLIGSIVIFLEIVERPEFVRMDVPIIKEVVRIGHLV